MYHITNNRRLVTLAEHTSDHGKPSNSNPNEWGEGNSKTAKELLLKTLGLKVLV